MIPTVKLVYDFKRKFNSINSSKTVEIDLVDIIGFLNEAYQIVYENRIFVSETNEKVRNDLKPFEEKNKKLELVRKDTDIYFAEYPDSLYKRLNQIGFCKKDCCSKVKKIIPRIVQSDDLYEALQNPYRNPDFFFEQLIMDEAKDGLYIYTNGFLLEKIVIDYYRKPNELHAHSLVECEGPSYYDYGGRIITADVDCEMSDTFINNSITDIAVLLAQGAKGKVTEWQTTLQTILQTNTLFR